MGKHRDEERRQRRYQRKRAQCLMRGSFVVIASTILLVVFILSVFGFARVYKGNGLIFLDDDGADDDGDHHHTLLPPHTHHRASASMLRRAGGATPFTPHLATHAHRLDRVASASRLDDAIAASPLLRLDTRNLLREPLSGDTFYLGHAPSPHDPNRRLHGYAFVHTHGDAATDALQSEHRALAYQSKHFANNERIARHFARNATATAKCAEPIAYGAHMKRAHGYYVYARNSHALDAATIVDAVENAAESWRCVCRAALHVEPLGPLLGVAPHTDLEAHDNSLYTSPTGENVVLFAHLHSAGIADTSTLAITITWGIFDGDVESREIEEFTMIFNDAHRFGDCGQRTAPCDAHTIDLQSVATHEMGHALVGLDDLYDAECSDATMFWSTAPREVQKRTLSANDVDGTRAMFARFAAKRAAP